MSAILERAEQIDRERRAAGEAEEQQFIQRNWDGYVAYLTKEDATDAEARELSEFMHGLGISGEQMRADLELVEKAIGLQE